MSLVSGYLSAVTQQSYAHVLCPLCMPQTCWLGDTGKWEGAGDAEGQADADVCHVCSTPLAVSSAMEKALKQVSNGTHVGRIIGVN